MGITIEELKKLDKNTYQIIDIRDENEIAHGAIPGAVATPADSIEGNENIDFSKKLVICFAAVDVSAWKLPKDWKRKEWMR